MNIFAQANKVENFLRRFSHPFENLETRIWHSLIANYYGQYNIFDEKTFERGFVIYIDKQHTKKGIYRQTVARVSNRSYETT